MNLEPQPALLPGRRMYEAVKLKQAKKRRWLRLVHIRKPKEE